MSDFTIKQIGEMEGIYGGAFKRARAELEVTSFGMQVIEMPPNSPFYPEHDHLGDGQEEVYVVLGGSGEIEIDGQRFPLDPDTFVRVGAAPRRKVWPGAEGMRLLIVGSCPGKVYDPPEISKLGSPEIALGKIGQGR